MDPRLQNFLVFLWNEGIFFCRNDFLFLSKVFLVVNFGKLSLIDEKCPHGRNYHNLSYLNYFKTWSSDFSWRCCGVAVLSQGDVVVEISGNRPYRDITMWTYCIIAVPMWKCHVMLCHENVMSMTKKKQSLLQCYSMSWEGCNDDVVM